MLKLSPQPNEGKIPSALYLIALLARRFGINVDPSRSRRELSANGDCLSSSDTLRASSNAGLKATGLRPSWNGLTTLSEALPAIVPLRDGSSVLLDKVEVTEAGQTAIIRDVNALDVPIKLTRLQFCAAWLGDVILVQSNRAQISKSFNFNLKMVVDLVFREKGLLCNVLISSVVLSFLALAPILFFRLMSERVLPYHATSSFVVICLIFAVLVVFEIALSSIKRHALLLLTNRVDVKITTELFNRVLSLPVDYFERNPAGLTMHKMAQISRVRTFLVGQVFGAVLDGAVLIFFLPVMFVISPTLTAVVVLLAALICAWIVLMLPTYKAKSGAVEGAEAQRGAFLAQCIQGIRTVKTLAIEDRQIREWDALTANIAEMKFKESRFANTILMVVTPLERLMVTGSFGLGVYFALTTTDPYFTGTLFTFMLLSQRLAAPLMQASQLIQQYDEARTAIGVIGSLVNQEPEQGRSRAGVRNPLQGHVEFSGVVFQYKGALKPALKNVFFEIPQGTTLGVMGRSGSGKTTITRLLQRLNPDYSGLVKVDGIDVRNFDLTHFRSSLGVVLQENFLFSGTIRSNITMAKLDATFDEMVHAARLAGAEEFIDKLPAGYETYVYEGSPNLSGGQRQRLAIARALITDPKILILDEATSALDAESEAIVNANIERISQGRTVITISHRLASLVKADAILVMEQGEVNDIGKHEELLKRNEIYAHLWFTQNPHSAPTAPAAPGGRPQLTYRRPQNAA